MPRKPPPPPRPYATFLTYATTPELIAELKRRSLGCMIACVRAEEDGDVWLYALKGSPILLGAMSAALSMQTTHRLKTLASSEHADRSTRSDFDGSPMEV